MSYETKIIVPSAVAAAIAGLAALVVGLDSLIACLLAGAAGYTAVHLVVAVVDED